MTARCKVIAALLALELAIVGEAIAAVQGGLSAAWPVQRADAHTSSGERLVEGGPKETFRAGARPAVTIDIGYADLTIRTADSAAIDVSAGPSFAYGMLGEHAPLTARQDGETIRIAKAGGHDWSIGDDRMVTVVVPPQTRVTVVSGGDIRAAGLRAEASFTSVGRGSVTLDDYDAPALAVSSNGRVILRRVAATHIDATSKKSRVEGEALRVRDGTIESDGRMKLGFATGADALVHAQTDSGSVTAADFAPAVSVVQAARSSDASDDDASSRTLRVGAGTGRLNVHVSEGDIELSQS